MLGGCILAAGAGGLQCSSDRGRSLEDYLAHQAPVATVFAFPVGPNGSAEGYYDAQPFGKNRHLGSDWNGVGGGNTDFGDPVLAVADGVVVSATKHRATWGRVIRIVHNMGEGASPRWTESLYGHLATITVRPYQIVRRGQQIGTIGNADGKYRAHLHLEIRSRVAMPLGKAYGSKTDGYLDPTAFIQSHR